VLGVPCLTLRDNTERPVTVSDGSNRVVGRDPATIRSEIQKIMAGRAKEGRTPPLWDGQAAARIVDILEGDLRGGR
jgi:UDP-N-acetylglucosamine 2-epimerase (non-hydrolysing)